MAGIAAGGVVINPNGETIVVDLQNGGTSATVYSEATLENAVSLPSTGTSTLALYVAKPDVYTLSVLIDGLEMAGALGST